ncbi:polymorphic outer membrane protein middle domain-containing protein [Chlamydiifrater volucris]|uniref:polymorphic outer membrane protein middle domain-containing protein n=1 Tax=Chlamydiifrater volucris TaxID=2681470 RepID=UPI001BD08B99|nr:polymorphic outer membrane protein middle domain-containing protein [Chlamydiifrater volucris]
MRKRQSLYLVALALLTNLATCQGSALPDNASLIENAFDTVEKDGVTIHTMNRDFTVSSFVETILSPYHLMMTPNKVLFQGNDHSFILSYLNLANQVSEENTSDDISFVNFKEIKIEDSGGMSYVIRTENLDFSGNKEVSIRCNQVPTDANKGGCLQSNNLTLSNNQQVFLQNNIINQSGGSARVNDSLDVFNNDLLVASNNSGKNGGCFCCINNTSIACLRNNNVLIFENNFANSVSGDNDPGGGAIVQLNGSTEIEANNSVVFYKNQTSRYGGAIASKKLNMSKNLFSLFISNISASKGGALYIRPSGELSLNADKGDLIFHNNTSNLSRNSISLDNGAKFFSANAKKGCKIHFNDPITAENLAEIAIFNEKSSSNSGKIVFSLLGGNLREKSNGISKIQKLRQEDGILVVKEGATLASREFSQTGGWLVLGSKGSAGTYYDTTGSGFCNFSSLAVDVSSALHSDNPENAIPSLVIGKNNDQPDTDAKISVFGPIYLTNENLSLYEYDSKMSAIIPPKKFLALNPGGANSNNIDVSSVDLTTQPAHHGYQGSWLLSWENATEEGSIYLVGSWVPNGQYLPNPEIEGKLLANSLISSKFAVSSFLDAIHQQNRNDLHFLDSSKRKRWKYDLQGSFISSIHSFSKKIPFHYRFSGFSAAASAFSFLNNQLGVAVSKISCHTDHKDFEHQISSPLLSAAVFSSFYPKRSFVVEIRGALSISKGNNIFKNNEYKIIDLPEEALPYYKMLKKDGVFLSQDEDQSINISSATFRSYIFSNRWDFFLNPVPRKFLGTHILAQNSPFCSIQAFFSDFSKFRNTEITLHDRNLKKKHSAIYLFLPIGTRLNLPFRFLGRFAQTEVSFSYIPLAYRRRLILEGSLPCLPKAVWETSDSGIPRNSAKCSISQEINFKDFVKINTSYSLHYIYSSFLQSANLGIQTIF